MNEIQLAQMADRLQKSAATERINVFVTTSKEINQREVDLVNGELERRGCDLRVVKVLSVEAAFRVVEAKPDEAG